MNLLILGGTAEAAALARAVADDARIRATVSLAGRTTAPAPLPVPRRSGGFGGADGLAAWLAAHRTEALIDATHPFAAQITRHAEAAARSIGLPLLVLRRPEWRPVAGDRWQVVPDIAAAAAALGRAPRRVLLTVGRQELAPFLLVPWHHYVLRSVEPPPEHLRPPHSHVITARGPFREEDEIVLLQQHRIDLLVTKNAGGEATAAKLAAARALGVAVLMVERPPAPEAETVETVAAALAWLDAHHSTSPRGV